ncbi:hypothetical protein uvFWCGRAMDFOSS50C341_011 [Freshwater phage uvFW-CGR-AMDFOS-S50-C341]|nr:hypothetical protein uvFWCGRAMDFOSS50C341_011 [Freshwater phage uvFW-CGR-AMDFOS-S50-C341]
MATQWTAGTTSGQVLTAATLNTIGAAWVTYTPAPIQGGFLTQFTTNYSKYALFQKTCIVQQKITMTGSGGAVAGQNIYVNLPFAAASLTSLTGSYYYLDSGTANYGGPAIGALSTNYLYCIMPNLGVVGANPSIIAAVNDVIQFTCSFEVA